MPDVGSSWPNLHEILDYALQRTLRVMAIEAGAICLLDASPGRLTLVAHRGLSQDLASMRGRTEMLGGTFEITSGSGKGTRVVVRIPCATGD